MATSNVLFRFSKNHEICIVLVLASLLLFTVQEETNIGSWPISSRADDLLFRFSNTNKIQIYMHVPVFDRIETKSWRSLSREENASKPRVSCVTRIIMLNKLRI